MLIATCVLAIAVVATAAEPGHAFFAFDNGTGRDQHVPLEEQAKMLKELGYAGIGYTGTARIAEMLAAARCARSHDVQHLRRRMRRFGQAGV